MNADDKTDDLPTTKDASKLKVRSTVFSDLPEVDRLCESVHFDIGLHNLQLYFQTSSEQWRVVRDENNELVAADAYNILPNGLRYGYIIVVRDDWRGYGASRSISSSMYDPFSMGSAQKDAIDKLRFLDIGWLEKRLSMFAYCQKSQINQLPDVPTPNVRLELISSSNIQRVLEYDQEIYRLDRQEFVRRWTMPDDRNVGFSVGAFELDSSRCVGYGSFRLFTDYYGIQPVYADTPEIATAIMTRLLKICDNNVYLYLPAMADKRATLAFCHRLHMKCTSTELRECDMIARRDYVQHLPMHKVYTVHEYFPV